MNLSANKCIYNWTQRKKAKHGWGKKWNQEYANISMASLLGLIVFITTASIQLEFTSATVVLFMKLKTYRRIIIRSKH